MAVFTSPVVALLVSLLEVAETEVVLRVSALFVSACLSMVPLRNVALFRVCASVPVVVADFSFVVAEVVLLPLLLTALFSLATVVWTGFLRA